ncbi:pistil-specific extensin-like protein [Capsicum chacoense]
MLNLEESDLLNTSDLSREELNKRQAEYIRLMNLQDNILKKKAQTRWFEEGDSNTKYFHSVIRERRRRLQLNRIKNHKNKWVQGSDKIAKAAIQHFKKLFNSPHYFNDFNILNSINPCITDDENNKFIAVPDLEEVKVVVSV